MDGAMKKLISVILLLTLSAASFADMTTYDKAVHLGNEVQMKPVALASGTTSVVSQDVFLTSLFIMATSSITVTVQDKQGTPIPIFASLSTAAGTTYFLPPGVRYWCSGGISVVTSGPGAYIYASWEQRGAPNVSQ